MEDFNYDERTSILTHGGAPKKSRYKDKNGKFIYEGDLIRVCEYPDKFVGGSLDFEGIVEYYSNTKEWVVTYFDIGEDESFSLSMFPIKGREVLKDDNLGKELANMIVCKIR